MHSAFKNPYTSNFLTRSSNFESPIYIPTYIIANHTPKFSIQPTKKAVPKPSRSSIRCRHAPKITFPNNTRRALRRGKCTLRNSRREPRESETGQRWYILMNVPLNADAALRCTRASTSRVERMQWKRSRSNVREGGEGDRRVKQLPGSGLRNCRCACYAWLSNSICLENKLEVAYGKLNISRNASSNTSSSSLGL